MSLLSRKRHAYKGSSKNYHPQCWALDLQSDTQDLKGKDLIKTNSNRCTLNFQLEMLDARPPVFIILIKYSDERLQVKVSSDFSNYC